MLATFIKRERTKEMTKGKHMKMHKEGNVAFQATPGDVTLFAAAISIHEKGSSGLVPPELLYIHQKSALWTRDYQTDLNNLLGLLSRERLEQLDLNCFE